MRVLVAFLREECRRAGFAGVVLGLSGGIDSAVVAALAVRAFGIDHVHVFAMPWRGSDPRSLADGRLVAASLGLELPVIDLTAAAEGLIGVLPGPTDHRVGNLLARLRMTVLYDQSMRLGELVVGTGNKTELLLGYSTQFGDLGHAINPIGDLYKSQVRALARHLGTPRQVIDKAPSADLWSGQTDEGEFGFTYEQADAILNALVDERRRPEDLVAAGHDEDVVRAVERRMVQSQYKRRSPVIAKLSGRTIGMEFRYPRDWRT